MLHIPVLLEETIFFLSNGRGVYVDLTTGEGGHSRAILERLGDNCEKLICFDRDIEIQNIAKESLKHFPNVIFVNSNFSNIKNVLNTLGVNSVRGIIADLGLSMYHYKDSGKGFSFLRDDRLDMSLDGSRPNAYDVVNTFTEKEISDIIFSLAEERFSRRIAMAIVNARKIKKIETTKELASIVEKSVGRFYRKSRLHPATKTFQAIRIFVNNEIENLKKMIADSVNVLDNGGRLLILTYHSIEDRVVKFEFKNLSLKGFKILTKKPIIPSKEEIKNNTSARSAKLRVIEKTEVLKCQGSFS